MISDKLFEFGNSVNSGSTSLEEIVELQFKIGNSVKSGTTILEKSMDSIFPTYRNYKPC